MRCDNVTLHEMDQFPRAVWLGCCGHQSDFTIDDAVYAAAALDRSENEFGYGA